MIERALQSGASALSDRRSGQKSLFGDLGEEREAPTASLPEIPEFPEKERLIMEKEVLGFYRSSHPLAEYAAQLTQFCSHTTADIPNVPDRGEVILGGMLSAIKFAHTKKPRPGSTATKYANFDLEDREGAIRCIVWPEDFVKFGQLVQPEAVLLVRGTIDRRGGDEANLIVNELVPLDELESRYTTGLIICLDERDSDSGTLKKIHEIVRGYPGPARTALPLLAERRQPGPTQIATAADRHHARTPQPRGRSAGSRPRAADHRAARPRRQTSQRQPPLRRPRRLTFVMQLSEIADRDRINRHRAPVTQPGEQSAVNRQTVPPQRSFRSRSFCAACSSSLAESRNSRIKDTRSSRAGRESNNASRRLPPGA